MKFIQPKVELIATPEYCTTLKGMARVVEKCGRLAYKSEDKITKNSYAKFLNMLAEKGHLSPFEHGTVYLKIPAFVYESWRDEIELLMDNPYTTYESYYDNIYFTTNWRVIVENNLWELVKEFYINYDSKIHDTRLTFKIICDRGISHELMRHRVFSFTQESTRYCNYTKGKFNGQICCVIPSWCTDLKDGEEYIGVSVDQMIKLKSSGKSDVAVALIAANTSAEAIYETLIAQGKTPQEARIALPTGLKTEVAMTGTLTQWKHFLSLRSPKYGATGVHPDMAIIADKIYELLVEDKYIIKKENNDTKD